MTRSTETPNWQPHFQRLDGAYAPSTMRSYRTDVEAFETWCLQHNVTAFPAELSTVCRFLEDQGKEKAPNTVRRRLYAIRKIHRLLKLPDPTHDEEINLTFRRIKRQRAVRPRQAKGLTRDNLDLLLRGEPDDAWGLRNRAMLTLGYELLTRRSELIALRDEDLQLRSDNTYRVTIRRCKSDRDGQGRLAFTSKATAELIREWRQLRGPHVEWLFCPIYHGKAVNRNLSATTLSSIIRHAAERAGFSDEDIEAFTGHSMRVGAAQDLLRRGFDTAAIMRAGGWKSLTTLTRYLEEAEHNVWE